jgi:hypothetical protein
MHNAKYKSMIITITTIAYNRDYQEEELLGTILYILPLRVRIYKYPSGPTWISVITPNPCPNTAPPS